jgi:hypothetical protein
MGKLTGRFFSLFFLLFLYYNQLMQTQKKHFKVSGILLVLLVLFSPGQANSQWKQPIALQPFGTIEPQLLQQVVNGIKKIFCKVEVDIQPAIPLPKYAYYKPRNRYRAEKRRCQAKFFRLPALLYYFFRNLASWSRERIVDKISNLYHNENMKTKMKKIFFPHHLAEGRHGDC